MTTLHSSFYILSKNPFLSISLHPCLAWTFKKQWKHRRDGGFGRTCSQNVQKKLRIRSILRILPGGIQSNAWVFVDFFVPDKNGIKHVSFFDDSCSYKSGKKSTSILKLYKCLKAAEIWTQAIFAITMPLKNTIHLIWIAMFPTQQSLANSQCVRSRKCSGYSGVDLKTLHKGIQRVYTDDSERMICFQL